MNVAIRRFLRKTPLLAVLVVLGCAPMASPRQRQAGSSTLAGPLGISAASVPTADSLRPAFQSSPPNPDIPAGTFVEFARLMNSSLVPQYKGADVETRAEFLSTGEGIWAAELPIPPANHVFIQAVPAGKKEINPLLGGPMPNFLLAPVEIAEPLFSASSGQMIRARGTLSKQGSGYTEGHPVLLCSSIALEDSGGESGGGAAPAFASVARPPQSLAPLPAEVAATVTSANNWRALLIGISDYSATGGLATSLDGVPTADVQRLGELLESEYGFSDVRVLIDGEATRSNILSALTELRRTGSAQDNVLVYYAGHGLLPDSGVGVWLPADARTEEDGISSSEVRDRLANLPAQRVLLVSDSCFSGVFATRAPGEPRYEPGLAEDREKAAEVSVALARNTLPAREVITSGNMAPVPNEGIGACAGVSPFACALLNVLRAVPAGAAVSTSDVYVTSYISVRESAAGQAEAPRPQRATLQGHGGGEFYFLRR